MAGVRGTYGIELEGNVIILDEAQCVSPFAVVVVVTAHVHSSLLHLAVTSKMPVGMPPVLKSPTRTSKVPLIATGSQRNR